MLSSCHRYAIAFQLRRISWFRRKKDENEVLEKVVVQEEQEPQNLWGHLSEDEIMAIRNKSQLTTTQREELMGELTEVRKFDLVHQYSEDYIRRYYAKYGKKSGLKPGVMWPSKEKLEFVKRFEQTFYPPLSDLLEELKSEKLSAAEAIKKRDEEIAEKLKKLPQYKKEFFAKVKEREKVLREEKKKKEKLVQDIREYLGYDIDPHDDRFKEALLKKEEEDKLKSKGEKKETKQQKLLAKLAEMVDDTKTSEKTETAKKTEES